MTQNGIYEWTDPDDDGVAEALRNSGSGGASIGTATPLMDGTATAGTSTNAAADDHRHPTDTTLAPLASPTFAGTPALPTGTTGVTQTAGNNTTRIATTAFVTTAVAGGGGGTTTPLGTAAPIINGVAAAGSSGSAAHEDHVHPTDTTRAAITSPTFLGTPTLPSPTVATTQTAGNNSTKIATTAYVDTADALKANLASPTFTGTATIPNIAGPTTLSGTVTLPSTTVGVTPSASDNSTKLATTAYVDTADALKANLASPTFTGTPTMPTGTTGTTQSANDNSTKLATTAYNTAQSKLYGPIFTIGPGTYASQYFAGGNTTVANAGDGRWVRIMIGQSGTLHDVSFLSATTGGNYNILVLDDGQANGTHTVRTCLAIKGATATPATGSWMTLDPSLTVAAGDTMVFMLTFDGTSAKIASSAAGQTGIGTLPNSNFYPGSGASTASQKQGGTILSANVPAAVNGTVTDANMVAAALWPYVVWRIS